MTSSGTYTFSPENADFLAEAFERAGIDPDSITSRKVTSALRSLNFLFSEWNTRGVKQYKTETFILTSADGFTQGAQSITLNSRILRVLNAYHRTGTNDTPLYESSRMEYEDMHNKTLQGNRPDRWFLDRKRDAAVMYLWPTIDNSNDSLVITALVRIQDVGNLSDTPDIPSIWYEALVSGLAAKLSAKYNPERFSVLDGLANKAFYYAKSEDRDTGPTRIKVSYGMSRRRR